MELLQTLYGCLFGYGTVTGLLSTLHPAHEKTAPMKQEAMNYYEDELKAIEDRYGDIPPTGLCIELTKLLEIVPRHRRRIDAYTQLIKYADGKGKRITITSRKTKSI